MNARAHRTAAAALATSLLFVLSACSDDDDDSAAQSTPTSAATVEATPSASASESASPSSTSEADQGTVVTIKLVDGKPSEKLDPTITISKGDKITLVITSDKAAEVHVHATDTAIEVAAGETVTKTITVDAAPGSYEVEVEDTAFKLFTLIVK